MSGGEEGVSNEDQEFEEETELNCPSMAGAIGVLEGTKSAVEFQDNQVGDVPGLLVVLGFYC